MADWSTGYQLAQQGFAQAARNRQARAALAQEAERQGSMLQLGQSRLEQDAAAQTSMDAYRRAMVDQATKNFELDQEAFNFRKEEAMKPPPMVGPPLDSFFEPKSSEPGMAGGPFLGAGKTLDPKDAVWDPYRGMWAVKAVNVVDSAAEAAKPRTEIQQRNAEYAAGMAEAESVLKSVMDAADPTSFWSVAKANLPAAFQSEAMQRYLGAKGRWTEFMLRKLSGANTPEPEIIRITQSYFPRWGDTEKTILDKNVARARMLEVISQGSAPDDPDEIVDILKRLAPKVELPQFDSVEEFEKSGLPEANVLDPGTGTYRKRRMIGG